MTKDRIIVFDKKMILKNNSFEFPRSNESLIPLFPPPPAYVLYARENGRTLNNLFVPRLLSGFLQGGFNIYHFDNG